MNTWLLVTSYDDDNDDGDDHKDDDVDDENDDDDKFVVCNCFNVWSPSEFRWSANMFAKFANQPSTLPRLEKKKEKVFHDMIWD